MRLLLRDLGLGRRDVLGRAPTSTVWSLAWAPARPACAGSSWASRSAASSRASDLPGLHVVPEACTSTLATRPLPRKDRLLRFSAMTVPVPFTPA